MSVVRVLRQAGVEVDFPEGQTCCGQPLYNSGYTAEARKLAERTLNALRDSDYVVVPSGSCGAMMRVFYLDLFADDPEMQAKATDLRQRVYEFTEFLTDVVGYEPLPRDDTGSSATVAYHPSCHLLREMEVKDAPQRLLDADAKVSRVDLPDAEQCCGFGGTVAVKYPHISEEMLADKVAAAMDSGAGTLTACDMGCLMHIGGAVSRRNLPLRVRHIAQILDGEAN